MLISRISPMTCKLNTLEIDVTEDQLLAWKSGTLIQDAMPLLTLDEREFLISGLFPGEFERLPW